MRTAHVLAVAAIAWCVGCDRTPPRPAPRAVTPTAPAGEQHPADTPAVSPPPGYTAVHDPDGNYRVFLPGRPVRITFTTRQGPQGESRPDPSRSGYRSKGLTSDPEVVAYSVRPGPNVPRADAGPDELVGWFRIRDPSPINNAETVGQVAARVGGRPGAEWRVREVPSRSAARSGGPAVSLLRFRVVYLVSDGSRVYAVSVTAQGTDPDPLLVKTVRESFAIL